ncbi:hypothetical protein EZV77_17445 [Burkholderia thailandensis]|uniref:Uncharacterized protein n=1 Tax=Burkholderia thailandensis TaxID=57975 RepID=A0AAW9CZG9_BURTH|nr:hypothetical protein [Burkholderia thailandensis]MDD1488263.1 hypothetical protein [Burkholderia thailandensis]MDD1494493.1 hypothetical protein [Burkholderia thailandensis]MDW9238329.1 hypothetical protein [Burkholderia thailandensis]MDW9254503.1 hypothetical protein [Burkholderia thailandensis]
MRAAIASPRFDKAAMRGPALRERRRSLGARHAAFAFRAESTRRVAPVGVSPPMRPTVHSHRHAHGIRPHPATGR